MRSDGLNAYSRSGKFTQTFFHYPSKNPHSRVEYEKKLANQTMKTFHKKKNSQYNQLLSSSSALPAPNRNARIQPNDTVTGTRKRPNYQMNSKNTNPISLRLEPQPKEGVKIIDCDITYEYKQAAERRFLLPSERKLSRNDRMYHSQIGLSLEPRQRIEVNQSLNNSKIMKKTLQYEQCPEVNRYTCFDNFKYNSRK